MALKYPDRLESNNPSAYGIVRATEVTGHRTVQNIEDLYSLSDAILSDTGNNTDNDAIGQKWYVINENREYELVDWNNRKSASGWIKLGDLLPEEGIIGQVLTKTEEGAAWQDPQAVFPEGGTVGQVLKKTSSGTEWANDNDTTYQKATTSTDGLMSKEDKNKLDNLIEVPSGGTEGQVLKKTSTGVEWSTDNNTTYEKVTQQTDGLMSKEDKAKLDNITNQATLSEFVESTESNENLEIEATDTINQGFGKLQKAIKDNELTIAQALNAFKDNVGLEDLNASLPDMSSTHYMTSATTIVECLQALDSKLYEVEQALTLKTV